MARTNEKDSESGHSSNRRDLRDDEQRHEIERLQRDNAQTQSRLARLLNEDFIPHRGRSQARVHSRAAANSTTAGKSGRGSFTGVSKKPSVPKPERHVATGSQGTLAQSIVNTPVDNSFRSLMNHTRCVYGSTSSPMELARIGEKVLGDPRDNLLSYRLERIPKDLRAFKEASTTRVKVTPSFEPSQAPRALQRPFEMSTVPGIRCIGCDLSSHSLKDCLYAPNGYVEGCIFCNTHTHKTDACRQFGNMNLENKVKTLVHQRQWRPALKTAIMWWDYLMDYIQKGGNDMPEEFPWSDDFAIAKVDEDDATALARVQEVWDDKGNVQDLPKDPKHASIVEVIGLYW